MIRNKLSGAVPFKCTQKWIEEDSLGQLITKFEKLSNNDRLIRELKNIKPDRNKIAHQGLLLSKEDWNDNSLISFRIEELRKIRAVTSLVLSRIRVELDKINRN